MRDDAAKLIQEAETRVAELICEGWTQQDFAMALGKLIGGTTMVKTERTGRCGVRVECDCEVCKASRRQQEVNKRRTKAKAPVYAQIGEAVTSRRLHDWYCRLAGQVLDPGVVRKLNVDSREPVYEIVAKLPSAEEYKGLRDTHFTNTIDELVGDANSIIQDLAGEMRDWHDGMPENLQSGSKGEEVEQAASDLESIDEVDVPESLKEVTMVHLPSRSGGSRCDRLSEAVSMLTAVKEFLEEEDVQQHLVDAVPATPAETDSAKEDDEDEEDDKPITSYKEISYGT